MGGVGNRAIYEAGEHYAISRLLLLGYQVRRRQDSPTAVVRLAVEKDDVDVAEVITRTTATNKLSDGWVLGENDEGLERPNRFYALINLREPSRPITYILPSQVVADVVAKQHAAWHRSPRQRGEGAKRQTSMRALRNSWRRMEVPGYPDGWMDRYREAWHLLAR